jgi:hypothetical protein
MKRARERPHLGPGRSDIPSNSPWKYRSATISRRGRSAKINGVLVVSMPGGDVAISSADC